MSDLSKYLAVFSSVGSVPTSLSGYGFGQRRHNLELGALGATTGPATSTAPQSIRNAQQGELVVVSTPTLKQYLTTLVGAPVAETQYSGKSPLQRQWETYVKAYREPHAVIAADPVSGMWIAKDAYLRVQANAAKVTAKKTTPTARPTSPTIPTVTTKNMDANTMDVQGILLRLGWKSPGTALTDGVYGPTTVADWKQSASKRKLDPYIVKKSVDGKMVTVREKTFLELKAVADALVPPSPSPGPTPPPPIGGDLLSLPPDQTTTLTAAVLGETLARASGKTSTAGVQLFDVYKQVATKLGVDPRIQNVSPTQAIVLKASWAAITDLADKNTKPPAPAPPSTRSQIESAKGPLTRAATEQVRSSVVATALNAAIQKGVLTRKPFTGDAWKSGMVDPIVKMWGVTDPIQVQALNEILVPGKLVSADSKHVRLTPGVAKAVRDLAAAYQKEKKEAVEVLKGYTVVNPAEMIERINALGVTTKKFDKSGGSKELADALATFFEETKTPKPSGDLVREQTVVTEDRTAGATGKSQGVKVYVKDAAISALANAAMSIKARADSTKAYRDSMVRNALQISSAEITVKAFQEALQDSVLSGGATGANKVLYSKVKVSGAFDKPTREAYTEIARTPTIGPAVLEYQRLLVAQQQAMTTAQVNAAVLEVQKQVWNDFLNQAVIKKGSVLSIKTLPNIAATVNAAAERYRKTISQDKQHDDVVKTQNKMLADAVAKSTAIMSVLDVQQGLSHMAEAGKIKKTGIKITGRSDKATNGFPTGGLFGVSSYIFQEGYAVPETVWNRYLKTVGIQVVSATQVKANWSDANYIALPPDLANVLSKAAGQWILKYGDPGAAIGLAPLPLDNQELRLRFKTPTVVTVQRPPPKKDEIVIDDTKKQPAKVDAKAAEKARKKKQKADAALRDAKKRAADAEKRAKDAEDLARQQQTDFARQEAERLKYEAAQAGQAVQQATQEATQANTALNLTINVAGGAGGESVGGAGGGSTASGGEPLPGPAPGPEPGPLPEEPIAPPPSGGGGGGGILLGLLALVGVGVALSKNKKSDENPETVYAGQ